MYFRAYYYTLRYMRYTVWMGIILFLFLNGLRADEETQTKSWYMSGVEQDTFQDFLDTHPSEYIEELTDALLYHHEITKNNSRAIYVHQLDNNPLKNIGAEPPELRFNKLDEDKSANALLFKNENADTFGILHIDKLILSKLERPHGRRNNFRERAKTVSYIKLNNQIIYSSLIECLIERLHNCESGELILESNLKNTTQISLINKEENTFKQTVNLYDYNLHQSLDQY